MIPKGTSGVYQPELGGNTQMPPTGCYNKDGNKNVERAGHMSGGGHYSADNTASQALGPKSGYMGIAKGENCGTVNPHNLNASKQHGGGCGCAANIQMGGANACSSGTAAYGFVDDKNLGELRGSYAPATSLSGGKRRKSKSNSKSRKHRKGRKSSKHSRKHKKSHKSRKHIRKHKSHKKRTNRRHTRSNKRRTMKHRHRRRGGKYMRGGYAQLGTNRPFSTGYSTGRSVSPSESALANPNTHTRKMIARDNYNHYTGKGSLSPVLDQAAN